MRSTQSLNRLLANPGCAALVLLAGCASVAPDPGLFVSSPDGTVSTFHRVSSGSYGTSDQTIAWTQKNDTWQGRPVVRVSSERAGTNIMDPATHGVLAQINIGGNSLLSFDPPIAYQWPLVVGKAWTSRHTMTIHGNNTQRPLEMNFRVEAYEDVTVPAGRYKAFRMVVTSSFGEVEQVWTAPSLGIGTVKRVVDRPASHPMGPGHLEAVLLSMQRP